MGEFRLKSIHKDTVKSALKKAGWYRALNEPLEAESICRDVLAVEPDNQEALATLLLALSDQFARRLGPCFREAKELVPRLDDEYERAYYAGLIAERRAKCQYQRGRPGGGHLAYQGLREAMEFYEAAETLRPAGNDDAALRWNTCARLIDSNPGITPSSETFRDPVELE